DRPQLSRLPPAGRRRVHTAIDRDRALDGLEVGPARWPPPRRLIGPGFDDGLWVHEGAVRGTVPLPFAAAPGGGDHVVVVTVPYQACDDASCLVPSSMQLRVPVREATLVGRSLPSPPSKTRSTESEP